MCVGPVLCVVCCVVDVFFLCRLMRVACCVLSVVCCLSVYGCLCEFVSRVVCVVRCVLFDVRLKISVICSGTINVLLVIVKYVVVVV